MSSILTFLGLLLVAFVILLVPAMVAPYTPKYGSVGIADFTDRVEIGRRTIIGARNSSVWTHNWQRTVPVSIGDFVYVGSEVRVAPGGCIPSRCIIGIALPERSSQNVGCLPVCRRSQSRN